MAKENDKLKGKKVKWATYTISMWLSWAVLGYVNYFSTDHLHLNVGVVGTIFLASKILDAISNFIVATIVDNHKFKKGKGRPWNICIIPYWLCVIIMFSIPASLGNTAKYIMLFLMYSLVNAVFATILTCVENIYLKHAFLEESERTTISTIASGLGTLSMIAGTILMPVLISIFEKMNHGWTIMTAVIGIPMALIGSIRYFTIPEVDVDKTSEEIQHVTIKDTIQAIISNKYTIIIMFMNMAIQIATAFNSSPMTYYFKYVVDNISQAGLIGAMSVPALAILVVLPKLAERFGRAKVLRTGMLISMFAYFFRYLAGGNMIFLCITTFIGTTAVMPLSVFGGLMLIDSMDYDKWKNHRNMEGAVFAGGSLGDTIGTGVGASLVGLFLNAFEYNGALEVQSNLAIIGIKAGISFVPAFFYLIIFILLRFFDLDKKMPQIRTELAERND